MTLLIPLKEDPEYNIGFDGEVSCKQVNKLVYYLFEADEQEDVPKRKTINGTNRPLSIIPEGEDCRYYTIHYLAELMGSNHTHVSRTKSPLIESGKFLDTKIVDTYGSNTNYYRINREKIAESIIDAVEGYFFKLDEEEKKQIEEFSDINRLWKVFYEGRDSHERKKFSKHDDRDIFYGLVQELYKELRDSDSSEFDVLLSRLEEVK